jgi:hypothetical protein
VSPVKYEMGFYIPEDGILHSHCRENLKSYKPFRVKRWKSTRAFQPHHDPEVYSASEYQKIFRKMILVSKTRPASNLTANYQSIIQTM